MFGQNIPLGFAGGAAGGGIADFLLIAGGGGRRLNGSQINGPAAGGYRTSFSGGSGVSGRNSTLQSALTLVGGVTYTITIGGGGNGLSSTSGTGSSIVGDVINITCVGGAGGSGFTGGSGGSGSAGRGFTYQPTQIMAGGAGTAGEGSDGGPGQYFDAGGGGGAGQTGGAGNAAGNGSASGGRGGDGLYNSITGTTIGYAGGCPGRGDGLGFGPYNTDFGVGLGELARANSGSALMINNSDGAGSGFCVLRIPTANYSGTTTGNPTITTVGSDTVIQFTGAGTYTA